MICVNKIFERGYPLGVALYEVTYAWNDLPDRVQNGAEDHIEYVTNALEEVLGDGEWVVAPVLNDGIWVGIFRPYKYFPTGIVVTPLEETPAV